MPSGSPDIVTPSRTFGAGLWNPYNLSAEGTTNLMASPVICEAGDSQKRWLLCQPPFEGWRLRTSPGDGNRGDAEEAEEAAAGL